MPKQTCVQVCNRTSLSLECNIIALTGYNDIIKLGVVFGVVVFDILGV